jgi:hypothetical protein
MAQETPSSATMPPKRTAMSRISSKGARAATAPAGPRSAAIPVLATARRYWPQHVWAVHSRRPPDYLLAPKPL